MWVCRGSFNSLENGVQLPHPQAGVRYRIESSHGDSMIGAQSEKVDDVGFLCAATGLARSLEAGGLRSDTAKS
jgi:hypothetical protein